MIVLLAAASVAAGANASERIVFLGHTGDAYWQVWAMHSDGTGLRQVTRSETEKARIAWYPDGENLLLVGMNGELRRIELESGTATEVETGFVRVHDAAVSPDGDLIALSANSGDVEDNHDIWVTRADGSQRRRVVSMPALQHEPRWSADGEWIYFLSGDGRQDHDVWRVRADGSAKEKVTVGSRYHFEVDVASDGRIAFSSNRTGDYEIYSSAASGEPTRWTDSSGLDGHPAWSPEGESLVFHSTRSGVLNLWRQEEPGGEAKQLTTFEHGARSPEWFGAAP